MKIPVMRGMIDRRILVNFQVAPEALARILPAPFRPKLINSVGMAGICLIRLKHIRPRLFPAALGMSSENAAHRMAVEWQDATGRLQEGVYIPRRDTSSRLNALAGGRLFPGVHHHARFNVHETADRFEIALRSDDDGTRLTVRANLAHELPKTSVFQSLEHASAFFQAGSLGYSATADVRRFQGMELHCMNWQVEPLAVEEVHSSFFENSAAFPPGSFEFDCALLMRGIRHEWRAQQDLCCPAEAVPALQPQIAGAHAQGAACELAAGANR